MDNDEYSKEAKERWGETEAYKQSEIRIKKMTKEDLARIKKESEDLMKEIVANMKNDPEDAEVQKLIDRHYNNLSRFYKPNLKLYRGLANMYVDDSRFAAYFEKHAEGLAKFMHDAMIVYCDTQENHE